MLSEGSLMKVAITDFTFPSLDIETSLLQAAGVEIISGQCKTTETLIPLVREADAVITQFAPVNRDVVAAMEKARVIVRYGIGADNVDLAAARERGIPVCNVPDYCIDEVADQTLAFILSMTRQVIPNCLKIRGGGWGLAAPLEEMRALRDLTVGLVGFGRIGREVSERLAAFKCRRLVFDPAVAADAVKEAAAEPVDLPALLAASDIVTLHCPSTPQTRKMIDAAAIAKMKPGSILINVGRGDLVDPNALIGGLQSGRLSGAALDVFDPEPLAETSPFRSMSNVVTASHIASASVRAVKKLRETAASLALKAIRGEPLPNVVNGVTPS
jgi:D-3-phosphoglycerate dehydrogenase